jgi:uncharacterized metal-binding protein
VAKTNQSEKGNQQQVVAPVKKVKNDSINQFRFYLTTRRLDAIMLVNDRTVNTSIGVAFWISATYGAKIEQNRASMLQTPIAVAENRTGKMAVLLL